MWYCDDCDKEVPKPAIVEVQDTTEYQGQEWPTGFVDEVEACPDCGSFVRSTLVPVVVPDDVLEPILF